MGGSIHLAYYSALGVLAGEAVCPQTNFVASLRWCLHTWHLGRASGMCDVCNSPSSVSESLLLCLAFLCGIYMGYPQGSQALHTCMCMYVYFSVCMCYEVVPH